MKFSLIKFSRLEQKKENEKEDWKMLNMENKWLKTTNY